jgi:hypothetical protein
LAKKNEFKIYLFITAFIATFCIGAGVYYIYNRFSVEEPLVAKFNAIEGIRETHIEKTKDQYTITFDLEPVENIQQKYDQLATVADAKLGNENYELILKGQSSSKLDSIYYEIQPVVYQALAEDQYVWMKNEINMLADKENFSWSMYIDANRLYLQLSEGNSYQYYVFERTGSKNVV